MQSMNRTLTLCIILVMACSGCQPDSPTKQVTAKTPPSGSQPTTEVVATSTAISTVGSTQPPTPTTSGLGSFESTTPVEGYGDFPLTAVAASDYGAGQMVLYRVKGDAGVPLLTLPLTLTVGARIEPQLSPDGQRVALVTTDESGGTTLWSGPFDDDAVSAIQPLFTGSSVSSFSVTGLAWSRAGELWFSTAGFAPGGLMNAGELWRLSPGTGVESVGQGAFNRLLGFTAEANTVWVARRLNDAAEWRAEGWGRYDIRSQVVEPVTFTAAGDHAFYFWLDVVSVDEGSRAVSLYSESGRGITILSAPAQILSLDSATGQVDSLWTLPEGSLGVSEPVWEPGATSRFAVEDQGWITIVDGHTGTSTRVHSAIGRLLTWSPQGLVVLDDNTLVLRLLTPDGLIVGELALIQSHPGSPHGQQ